MPHPIRSLRVSQWIRLFWLAKVDTRELILAQIRHPTKHLSNSALTLLPDLSLPELNDTLASSLDGPAPNEWLILRYATGEIVKRVEKYYLEHENDSRCASPLVFYFLKYDPKFGERELRRDLSTGGAQPGCYMETRFRFLDKYAWSEALERLMIEYLSGPNPRIESGAAWVLGQVWIDRRRAAAVERACGFPLPMERPGRATCEWVEHGSRSTRICPGDGAA